jgi:hypothetical protein
MTELERDLCLPVAYVRRNKSMSANLIHAVAMAWITSSGIKISCKVSFFTKLILSFRNAMIKMPSRLEYALHLCKISMDISRVGMQFKRIPASLEKGSQKVVEEGLHLVS